MTDAAVALTSHELRAELARACDLAGGQAAWARLRGVAPSQVSEAISGRRDLSESMINALGYMRVTRYVRIRGASNAGP